VIYHNSLVVTTTVTF